MTAATVGHNGGPQSLTDRIKIIRLRKLFARDDLNATQKCVGAWLIIEAGKDGAVTCGTTELQTAASVKRRDTVFSATKKLKQIGLVERSSDLGQRGRYEILPEPVVDDVAKAYEDSKSGTVEPVRFDAKQYGESGPVDDPKVVRLDRTSTVEADRFERTSAVEPYQSAPRAHARKENPSGLLSTSEFKNPPKPPLGASDDMPAHVQPVTDWNRAFEHDDVGGVVLDAAGNVRLVNGTRQVWLDRFGGDVEALDLALIEAAGSIQPNSKKPLKYQIERQLARMVRDTRDKDRRYAKAVADNGKAAPRRRGNAVLDLCAKKLKGDEDPEPRQMKTIAGTCKEI